MDYIVILDAGSQYVNVIQRRLNELRIHTRALPLNVCADKYSEINCKGVIITGGPKSVNDLNTLECDSSLWNLGKPVLGICYGMQLMNKMHGGIVGDAGHREDGVQNICVELSSPLFRNCTSKYQKVLLTHGDSVLQIAGGFESVASSGKITVAIQNLEKKLFSVQFHPEVELTSEGTKMLRSFVEDICCVQMINNSKTKEQVSIERIRLQLHATTTEKVLCLVSGGVDSTVCAALLTKAISKDRIICIHVNHGFMRHRESELVQVSLERIGVKVHVLNVLDEFLSATTSVYSTNGEFVYRTSRLCDVVDPEEKRKIIGDQFMNLMQNFIQQLQLDCNTTYLAQGTLYPDLIESANKNASVNADAIKTHHNDTFLVRKLRELNRIIEPLSEYFKDEVRDLGRSMGLPEELLQRQPFPGPGLAIRILCCTEPYRSEKFAEIQSGITNLFAGKSAHPLLNKIDLVKLDLSAILLPIRTVGVQGDGRSYSYAVAISATYEALSEIDFQSLENISRIIPQIYTEINRVTFLFGPRVSKVVDTITPTQLHKKNIEKLRSADYIVNELISEHSLDRKLSQFPVILIPIDFEQNTQNHSIVLRSFITNDFMTGRPATPGSVEMPFEVLNEMVNRVSALPGISRVLYDLTSKPPGTTEWE